MLGTNHLPRSPFLRRDQLTRDDGLGECPTWTALNWLALIHRTSLTFIMFTYGSNLEHFILYLQYGLVRTVLVRTTATEHMYILRTNHHMSVECLRSLGTALLFLFLLSILKMTADFQSRPVLRDNDCNECVFG